MNTALELLRLALDRGWALGLLVLIFCGLVLLTDHYGIALPVLVKEWAGVGALFGAATFLVSVATHIVPFAQNQWNTWRWHRETRRALADLTRSEKDFLRPFIIQGENTRYESIYDGVANGLQAKGIIYRASNLTVPGRPGMLAPCNLQPYARQVLNENRHLLD
jgi:hypothetical protein